MRFLRGLRAVLLLALAACSGESSNSAAEMSFRVDSMLIGDTYSDSLVSLSAPLGWARFPDSVVNAAVAALAEPPQHDPVHDPALLAIFSQEPEGASLAVSRYSSVEPVASPDSVARRQRQALIQRHPGSEIREDTFTYQGYGIHQILLIGDSVASFKLVLARPAEPIYQLDYVVPRSVYEREMTAIESSIGSLKPKH